MAIFAAAVARHAGAPFGWIHCSGTTDGLGATARFFLEENSELHGPTPVDPRDLTSPPPYEAHLSWLVVPETIPPTELTRLNEYLRLPILLQRLLSSAHTLEGPTTLLMTNVDALPPSVAVEGLARFEVQEVLRREHATLVITFRGIPPAELSRAFDLLYQVERPSDAGWEEAVVTTERGAVAPDFSSPTTLRDLLPWLGLPGVPVSGSGPGHYLP